MTPVLVQAFLFAAGIVGLYFGAEWLVRGAGRLARAWGISATVVGLTIVAFGTSAPELVVGVLAALRGDPELALGNVVGSNVMNVALILGVSAIFVIISVEAAIIRREIPVMIAITAATALLAVDGALTAVDGVILLVLFLWYFWVVFRSDRTDPKVEEEYVEFGHPRPGAPGRRGALSNLALIAAGVATMYLGAHALVESSIFFASMLGLSQLVIGLTVVAIGTSLPELATSMVAAWRKKSEIAVGNIVGSNVFNLCMILGVTSFITPIPVAREVLQLEFLIMGVISVVLLPLAWTRGSLSRREGTLLLAMYAVFMVVVLDQAGII